MHTLCLNIKLIFTWHSITILPVTKSHTNKPYRQRQCMYFLYIWVRFMVFNATFNYISVISWWSVLFVEETRETDGPALSLSQTLSHNVVSSTPCPEQYSTLVVIGTDCIGSCKSNYRMIMITNSPSMYMKECIVTRKINTIVIF